MSFCSYSSEKIFNDTFVIDNAFISDFLPSANASAVKVYIYGAYLCKNGTEKDNNLSSFAKVLNMTEQDVLDCFAYWQEVGVLQVLSSCPIEIKYIPLRNVYRANKKYDTNKYGDFNVALQDVISEREITATEYGEYYDAIETYHIEPDALLLIAKYCTEAKNKKIGYSYILTVAKNWATDGVTTAEEVKERIDNFASQSEELKEILKALKINRLAYPEEQDLYKKWINDYNFEHNVLIFVAKQKSKAKSRCSIARLDSILAKYYEMKLFSIIEIDEYEKQVESLYAVAKNVTKSLGLYYENLQPVIEEYITKWIRLGYDQNSLQTIAQYCFKRSIRSLEGMNSTISKLYKIGIITDESLAQYMIELKNIDAKIVDILTKLELTRQITSYDREAYKTWTLEWDMSEDLIDYSCTLAKGKASPLAYMNKLLASWHKSKITSRAQAENYSSIAEIASKEKPENSQNTMIERSYSKEELNALFDSLEEINL